eukprot:scaffold1504_cov172-Ochromonas_danica.AAC.11
MSEMDMETNPFSSSSGGGGSKEEQNEGGARAGGRKWTAEEDTLLRKGVEEFGEKWTEIAKRYFPHRKNPDSLRTRWVSALRPDLKKGPWSSEEDAKLVELVKQFGSSSWPKIASHMDGRSAASCSQRWRHSLDPALVRLSWSPDEDEIIKKFILEDIERNHVRSDWQSVLSLLPTKRFPLQLTRRYQYLKKCYDPNQGIFLSHPVIPVRPRRPEQKSENARKSPNMRRRRNIVKVVDDTADGDDLIDEDDDDNDDDDDDVDEEDEEDDDVSPPGVPWTEEEDTQLLIAVRKFGESDWTAVAERVSSSRSPAECKQRWERELSRLLNTSPWTKEEDDLLIKMRKRGASYDMLFKHLKKRTLASIIRRSKDLGVELQSTRPWTEEEISRLMEVMKTVRPLGKLVSVSTIDWKYVSRQMPSPRSPLICRDFYFNYQRSMDAKKKRTETVE